MNRFLGGVVWLVALLGFSAQAAVHHDLSVKLEPATHHLQAQDRILLAAPTKSIVFELHSGLAPRVTENLTLARIGQGQHGGEVPTDLYEVKSDREFVELSVDYGGEIFHPFSDPEQEYARGFASTPGQIGPDGVYLASSSEWVPRFGDELVTFDLRAELPPQWVAVSQGEELSAGANQNTWRVGEPQDEILLVAATFTRYRREGGIIAEAFLRTPDVALANRYLSATAGYLEFYEKLLGSYPYKKFALVENYWETGFGMPSFTLLGPKIIRFPFILASSYPHEILHNWWGNGVYVDYNSGNWCEGLTAYLADHLFQEQTSGAAAADYRRTTLRKYADFVSSENGGNDFPLSQFHERNNASTEAVGYGKSLMFYHMLRQRLGDDAFLRGLRTFYAQNRFHRATFGDISKVFEAQGHAVRAEFNQWVNRAGAPEIQIRSAHATPSGAGYLLTVELAQTQTGEPFAVRVPIAVHLEGVNQAFQSTIEMTERTVKATFELASAPVWIDVDPEFDVFRRLDPRESPAGLSQLLGAKKLLIVIPAHGELSEIYARIAQNWAQASEGEVKVVRDADVASLPADQNVWVLGWTNAFTNEAATKLRVHGVEVTSDSVRVGATEFTSTGHAFVFSGRNGVDGRSTLGWVAGDSEMLLAGLDRKLPHYSKYSYLVFEGADATAVGKGIWPVTDSPLSLAVSINDGVEHDASKRGSLTPRKALQPLLPAISERSVQETVEYLAAPSAKGRELGTPELDQIAQYIADKMQWAGLVGGGDNGFMQAWSEEVGAPKGVQRLTNVVGVLPGRDPSLKDELVVLGAHYDHLGLGWPDAREGNRGKIHSGADDNASGIAALLEVARTLTAAAQNGHGFARTIVFVAFTGEEAGLLGSRHFAGTVKTRVAAMVNMDTVGSLFGKPLTVLGVGSAVEWSQLLNGAASLNGQRLQLIGSDPGGSDQRSFMRETVPAVQLFSGATANYHRPSDTPEKLDYSGLVQVAQFAADTVLALADGTRRLTYNEGGAQPDPTNPAPGRKAFLGTVPDFAFPGPGVRVDSVVPASPAERAGLRSGDVILVINRAAIAGLRQYSDVLKTLRPGDEVELQYRRGEELITARAVAVER